MKRYRYGHRPIFATARPSFFSSLAMVYLLLVLLCLLILHNAPSPQRLGELEEEIDRIWGTIDFWYQEDAIEQFYRYVNGEDRDSEWSGYLDKFISGEIREPYIEWDPEERALYESLSGTGPYTVEWDAEKLAALHDVHDLYNKEHGFLITALCALIITMGLFVIHLCAFFHQPPPAGPSPYCRRRRPLSWPQAYRNNRYPRNTTHRLGHNRRI